MKKCIADIKQYYVTHSYTIAMFTCIFFPICYSRINAVLCPMYLHVCPSVSEPDSSMSSV